MSNDANNYLPPIAKDVYQGAFYIKLLIVKETTPLTSPMQVYPAGAMLQFKAVILGTEPLDKWESAPTPPLDKVDLPVSFLTKHVHREVEINYNINGVDSQSLKVRILP